MQLTNLIRHTKLLWGLLLLLAAGAFLSPVDADGGIIFLDPGNLTDILRQVSITGIMAIGMTLVILIGGIDLSVGTVMAFGSTICAMLLTQGDPSTANHVAFGATALLTVVAGASVLRWAVLSISGRPLIWPVSLLCALPIGWGVHLWFADQQTMEFSLLLILLANICIGLVIGAVSGLLCSLGRLQPFIVTLAMMITILGIGRLVAGADTSVYPIYTGINAPESFELLRESYWGLPFPGLVFLLTALVFWVLLARFRFGRYLYAIGSNEQAAWLSGINVHRIKITVFALSSMLAMVAGVLYAAQYRQGKPDAGSGLELDVIAAVVIGGSSLMGGKGTIPGTVAGVFIFGVLSNFLQLRNIDANTQLVLKGLIIVIAVLIQEGNWSAWRQRLKRNQKP